MPSFLAEQIERFGHGVRGEAPKAADCLSPADVTDMVALAVALLDRIERAAAKEQPPHPAWDEDAARRFVPLFKQWFEQATVVLDLARRCRRTGHLVEGFEEFVHRYNISKLFALDFEQMAESQRRWQRGERAGRPLDEVMDELRRRDRAAGV